MRVAGVRAPYWWSTLPERSRRDIEDEPVGSPRWWLLRLWSRIEAERPDIERLESAYQGHFEMSSSIQDRETRAKFTELLEQAQANFMRLVVDATAERCNVQGLRLGGTDEADDATWSIWQDNGMDAWQQVAFTEALSKRRSYLSVGDDFGRPRIEIEDALQCFVEFVPGSRTTRAAGIKLWTDDWTGAELANVYMPDVVTYWENEGDRWTERDDARRNPWGTVPLVPLVNRPTLLGFDTGVGEFEDLLPIQHRINETILHRLIASHFGAFMQKWATGIDVPEDDDGNPIPPFKPGVDQLWLGSEDAKFGQFSATDLDNYIKAIEEDVQHIAVLSRTPRHYFTAAGQSPSGDAIRSAEAGLVAKVIAKQRFFGESIEEALRLARQVAGLDTPTQAEVVWADPEFRTLGELTDAVIKQVQADLPGWALERVGYNPNEVNRIMSERMQLDLASLIAGSDATVDDEAT